MVYSLQLKFDYSACNRNVQTYIYLIFDQRSLNYLEKSQGKNVARKFEFKFANGSTI